MVGLTGFPLFRELTGAWSTLGDDARGTVVIFGPLAATAVAAFVASRIIRFLELKVTQTSKLWDDALFHVVKQDVLRRISDIMIKEGAKIAFPIHTVHLANSVNVRSSPGGNAQEEHAAARRYTTRNQALAVPGERRGGPGPGEQELARKRRQEAGDKRPLAEAEEESGDNVQHTIPRTKQS